MGIDTPSTANAQRNPPESLKKQPAWYPKYEESYQKEFQRAFKEISYEQFFGTLQQISDNWSGTSADQATSEVIECLKKLAQTSRTKLEYSEHQGMQVVGHADVLKLFERISRPLELSGRALKSADAAEAIALQKAWIKEITNTCSAIRKHPFWEDASSAFEQITTQKEQLSAFLSPNKLRTIKQLSIPAITDALLSFQAGKLPDNKVDDLLRLCTTLEKNAPKLIEQMQRLQTNAGTTNPLQTQSPVTMGNAPPPPPPSGTSATAARMMTLSEILPTLAEYKEAYSLLDMQKNQPLAKLLESINTLESRLEKAESVNAISEQIRTLPTHIQALREKNTSLVDNDYSLYFFDKVHISSNPLRNHVTSLSMATFGRREAPKSLDEVHTLLQNKQNELEKCDQGLDALVRLKATLPKISDKISIKALRETQTPLRSFFPLLMKKVAWNTIEKPIKESGGGFQITGKTGRYGQFYEKLKTELEEQKEPNTQIIIENERKLEKAIGDGISFKLDDYVDQLLTLSETINTMIVRYTTINDQITTWNTYSQQKNGKFWNDIGDKLQVWVEQASKIKETLSKQSTAIEKIANKPKPTSVTQKPVRKEEDRPAPSLAEALKGAPIMSKLHQPASQKNKDNNAVTEDEWDE